MHVAASEPLAQLSVKLCDVTPDGTSLLLTRGVLNPTHRDSHEHPTTLIPGQIYPIRLELSCISHVFAAGHRVRLSIAGADWPLAWPPPRRTVLTLYHGATHPSQLVLPVIPPRQPALPPPVFGQPDAPIAPARSEDGPREYTVHHNMVDGTTTVVVRIAGRTSLTEQDLAMSEANEKELSICEDDPLSCTAEMRRHLQWERPHWHIVIDSRLQVSCTAETFVVEIDLRAQHNGALVFTRRWQEQIPHVLG
ncbi:MAG: hypothetical protein HYZ72_11855 [Deltaproteobacteria bacterium]|nr:hypothetical protein [Deltaproteobacteria bacterium]